MFQCSERIPTKLLPIELQILHNQPKLTPLGSNDPTVGQYFVKIL